MTEKQIKKYLQMAALAAARSYSPYSGFRVGALMLCRDGSVFKGTNVENRSYGLTICAERIVIGMAVSRGLKQKFQALFVAAPGAEYPVPPCGACRQVLSEFVHKDFPVYYCGRNAGYSRLTMGELYPFDSLHELRNSQSPL